MLYSRDQECTHSSFGLKYPVTGIFCNRCRMIHYTEAYSRRKRLVSDNRLKLSIRVCDITHAVETNGNWIKLTLNYELIPLPECRIANSFEDYNRQRDAIIPKPLAAAEAPYLRTGWKPFRCHSNIFRKRLGHAPN
jgi:hypothetical protein